MCRCRPASLAGSARSPGQDSEERLNVRVGAEVSVVVEVGAVEARGLGAVAGDAGEEGFDVSVGADVAVAVEVGRAAGDAVEVDAAVEGGLRGLKVPAPSGRVLEGEGAALRSGERHAAGAGEAGGVAVEPTQAAAVAGDI